MTGPILTIAIVIDIIAVAFTIFIIDRLDKRKAAKKRLSAE